LPGRKAARIRVVHGFSFDDPSTWQDAFLWLSETPIKFKKVFGREWKITQQSAGADGLLPAAQP